MLSSVRSLEEVEQFSLHVALLFSYSHLRSVNCSKDKLEDKRTDLLSLYAIMVPGMGTRKNGYKVHETKTKLNQLFALSGLSVKQ